LKFTIEMSPVAKGRPKFTRSGFAYTPTKTREAEKFISTYVKSLGLPMFADDTPLVMWIKFVFLKPKSAKKRVSHTVKPDCTNLAKLVEDALNGVLYPDDSAIVYMLIQKEYGDPAKIEIEITEIQ
jgi:Holliday junction resolvase RusA-like endonuclease